ncbi:MAG: V-type ATPase subunit [Deltaproteobacteria bacterium]|nr:V-type ATPase subunit [Deltaproteobacteria bacterium]
MNLISPSYAFTTALFKAEEAKDLSMAMMREALQKSSIDDAVVSMKGSSIGAYLDRNLVKTFEEANKCLHRYIRDCLEHILAFRPPKEMVLIAQAYLIKFDVLNIKVALRRLIENAEAPFTEAGKIFEKGFLKELSQAQGIEDIAGIMQRCSLHSYARVVEQLDDINLRNVVKAETELDKIYFKELEELLGQTDDSDILKKALGIMVDLINLRILLRAVFKNQPAKEEAFIAGGEMFSTRKLTTLAELKAPELITALDHTRYSGLIREVMKDYDTRKDIRVVEKATDSQQLRLIRELLSPKVFSPAMVFLMLMVKEWEVRSARLVLKAVSESIPASTLSDYLEM